MSGDDIPCAVCGNNCVCAESDEPESDTVLTPEQAAIEVQFLDWINAEIESLIKGFQQNDNKNVDWLDFYKRLERINGKLEGLRMARDKHWEMFAHKD